MRRFLLPLLAALALPTACSTWEDGGGWEYGGNYRSSGEAEQACKNWAIDGVWDVQGDRIAPNLTHFANRNVFAGAALYNTEENLSKWLANPAEIKPGTFMPNLELTEAEINALIAYLGTLK